MITTETILSLFLGIGLAASAGFRVFLPLFALSLASHFNLIPLNEMDEMRFQNKVSLTPEEFAALVATIQGNL